MTKLEIEAIVAAQSMDYLPCGRGPKAFDCYGLVLHLLGLLGLPVPPDPHQAASRASETAEIVQKNWNEQEWTRCPPRDRRGRIYVIDRAGSACWVGCQ